MILAVCLWGFRHHFFRKFSRENGKFRLCLLSLQWDKKEQRSLSGPLRKKRTSRRQRALEPLIRPFSPLGRDLIGIYTDTCRVLGFAQIDQVEDLDFDQFPGSFDPGFSRSLDLEIDNFQLFELVWRGPLDLESTTSDKVGFSSSSSWIFVNFQDQRPWIWRDRRSRNCRFSPKSANFFFKMENFENRLKFFEQSAQKTDRSS